MQGSATRAVGLVTMLLTTVIGCGDGQSPVLSTEDSVPSTGGQRFDASSAGTITGRVLWTGPVPSVPPLIEQPNMAGPVFDKEKTLWPNPNAPLINADSHAVQGAVIFLRGVDAGRSRPWDLPPVRIVQQGQQFHVRQGDDDGKVGFVRRGDAVEMVSADTVFHSLHAGGAAYFTLAFPDPDKPRRRRLDNKGVVELSSAAGRFWMHGYLFVDEHPYYTRTAADGRFQLTDVPPGRYEVVCWLPDWREERHERDPETSLVTRLYFREPWETVRPVEVQAKGRAMVEFKVSAP